MPTITLGPGAGTTHTYKAQAVYTRSRWSNAWALNVKLVAVQATWSVAPSIPSATLVFDYGSIKEPGTGAFVAVSKLSVGRHYVRILYTDDAAGSWDWVGFFDIDDDTIFGTDQFSGRQVLTAYGIEKILADHAIDKTVFAEKVAGELTTKEAVYAATFNRDGNGNRNANKTWGLAPDVSFVFEPNLFDYGDLWTSADIVEHLLTWHTPRDEAGEKQIAIVFDSANVATWDHPVLDTSQQSTYSLIERLIDRRRLMVWWLEYNPTSDVMMWKSTSLASAAIPLTVPGSPEFPANANKVDINFDQDQFTQATIRREFDRYHKVIARGARRVSVGSFSEVDGTILPYSSYYNTGNLGLYVFAGSTSDGYSGLTRDEKQRLNAKVRADPKLENVYSFWIIPYEWEGQVRDGEQGIEPKDLFPDAPDFYYPEMFVLPELPLLAGIDYSGDPAIVEEPKEDAQEIGPLVVLKIGDKWVKAEHIGSAAMSESFGSVTDGHAKTNPDWSLMVYVPSESHGVRLKVVGKPQYFIAYSSTSGLSPLSEDVPAHSGIDFDDYGIATLAVLDPRYAEGTDGIAVVDIDILRTKILWLGDNYQQVYIAPQTVVGVDEEGALERSDGGYLRDDTDLLESIAKIAADWYTIDRRILDLRTTRLIDAATIGLGYMIENIGNPAGSHSEAINSVITQIDIQSPIGETETDPAEMRITTWAGELDVFHATREADPRDEFSVDETFVSPGEDTSFDDPVVP
jgi:hypothetical protein